MNPSHRARRQAHVLTLSTWLFIGLSAACHVHAADDPLMPKSGVYDASDASFERTLTVKPNGQFTLEVQQKTGGGMLRSGSGEGQLADAPGGWMFQDGRCQMALKRAAGGMQMKVQGCSSEWGDVPFDAKYVWKHELPQSTAKPAAPKAPPAAAPAPSPAPLTTPPAATAAAPTLMPTRRELQQKWSNIAVDGESGRHIGLWAKPLPGATGDSPLERFSALSFFFDWISAADYASQPAAQQAQPPVHQIPVPLPELAAGQGHGVRGDCVFGKSDKAVVVSVTTYHKTQGQKSRPVSAWMLDSRGQLQEIKPASKVKCPAIDAGY